MSDEVLEGELFKSYRAALEASNREIVDSKALATQLLAVRCETLEQEQWAADYGNRIAVVRKAIEHRRDLAKKPWWDNYNAIQKAPKEAIDLLLQIEAHFKAEIKRSSRARLASQAAALQAAIPAGPAEIARTVEATSGKADGVTLAEHWTWAPADGGERPATIAEAYARGLAIPPEYFLLDTKRLDREAREQKSAFAVTGCIAKRDDQVRWG